jgi:hypothetical protein
VVAALTCPESTGRVLEIGGRDVLTYAGMMTGYARARGLKRRLLAVPVLTPRLSSYWVHLVTPIFASIAQTLIRGLGNEVIVRDTSALQLLPAIQLLDYDAAIRLALEKIDERDVETAWSDALTSSQGDKTPVTLVSSEGMILERRQQRVDAPLFGRKAIGEIWAVQNSNLLEMSGSGCLSTPKSRTWVTTRGRCRGANASADLRCNKYESDFGI